LDEQLDVLDEVRKRLKRDPAKDVADEPKEAAVSQELGTITQHRLQVLEMEEVEVLYC